LTGHHREAVTPARRIAVERAVAALIEATGLLHSAGFHDEAIEAAAMVARLEPGRGGAERSVFRREGEHRVVIFGGDVFRIRETLGTTYLSRLLAHPGRDIHVLELVGSDPLLASDSGPLLDRQAARAYRLRIGLLATELAEAERMNDLGLAERCREEIQVLRAELARGEGIGGRERVAGSTSERARQAATKAMKTALGRIVAHSPALGRHLASTVRTGTYCRYDPDPRLPVRWLV
jgi:hypothetical protein